MKRLTDAQYRVLVEVEAGRVRYSRYERRYWSTPIRAAVRDDTVCRVRRLGLIEHGERSRGVPTSLHVELSAKGRDVLAEERSRREVMV